MKAVIRVLTLTTLVLAGTTVYYGQALMRERPRTHARTALAHEKAVAQNTFGPETTDLFAFDDTAPERASTTSAVQTLGGPRKCPDPDTFATYRRSLKRFVDPAEESSLRIEIRQSLHRHWIPIAAAMQMPELELQHFLDQILDASVRMARLEAECMANLECHCNSVPVMSPLAEERRQLIRSTLAPMWRPGYETYVDAGPERLQLSAMRTRLKDGDQLDEETTGILALALAEVRRMFIAEASERGQQIRVSSAGFAVHDLHDDKPPHPLDPANRDLTDQFNRRLDQVAARHLTPSQLKAFRALREERLDLVKAVTR